MKRTSILIVAAMLVTVSIYGQAIFIDANSKHIPVEPQKTDNYTVLDTAKLVVTYNVTMTTDIKSGTKEQDIQVLQIGNKYAKSYSKLQYEGDSIYLSYQKKGARNAPWFQKNVPPVEVYKNYLKKKMSVSHRLFGVKGVYFYQDDYPTKIEWKLTEEKKKLHAYNCQKAIGTFRGRTYEAWFTSEIPIKEGPYKFGGLPGLILEISDTQNHYVYTCIGIKRPKHAVPIKFWKWQYREIDREKLFNAVKRANNNPFQHLKLNGVELHVKEKGKAEGVSFPHNPIELE